MTTITIKDNKFLQKTEFESAKELFVFLREKLSPVTVFQVDHENIPKSILASIHKSNKNDENDIVDFKG